jgi:hypothetical protein
MVLEHRVDTVAVQGVGLGENFPYMSEPVRPGIEIVHPAADDADPDCPVAILVDAFNGIFGDAFGDGGVVSKIVEPVVLGVVSGQTGAPGTNPEHAVAVDQEPGSDVAFEGASPGCVDILDKLPGVGVETH